MSFAETSSSPSSTSFLSTTAVFLLSAYVLSRSNSAFTFSSSLVSRRLAISSSLTSLLSQGFSWDILALTISSLVLRRPKLALGTVLGACVANILGVFSLKVLVQRERVVRYDVSPKIQAVVLFGATTAVAVLWGFGDLQGRVYGGLLVAAFGAYVGLVTWGWRRGWLDRSGDEEDEDARREEDEEEHQREAEAAEPDVEGADGPAEDETAPAAAARQHGPEAQVDESTALISQPRALQKKKSSWLSTLATLFISLVFLALSGYGLSSSSARLTSGLHISDTVFGATLLSVCTTLPGPIIALVTSSPSRRHRHHHPSLIVAGIAGSNIFLLTLCLGITVLCSQALAEGSTYTQEIVWAWTSSAFLMVDILIGTHRLVGVAMLCAYVAFLALEGTVYKKP